MPRNTLFLTLALCVLALHAAAAGPRAAPLALLPRNPHYFLWRGRPTVLVASTEHYGSVLNADFDYKRYLDTIRAAGLNYTRLFSGVYSEPWGEPFNTLNPPPGRLLCPWARSGTPGYADGGNKFDLSRWDPAYFRRLRDFLAQASRRQIVVELTLFCNWYDDNQWRLSPLQASNNINGTGAIPWEQVNTLQAGEVLKQQEAMVRKIVTEVNAFDNVFFEVCNEPGADARWMDHMAGVIRETETRLPRRHLLANNFHVTPHLSVLNAHYDRDLGFVHANYHRNVVVGYDETGFDGSEDRPYRRQGWRFLLAGGGLYDNLDWSFSVAHPDGTETQWSKNLGGGSAALRRQLGNLARFLHSLDLAAMAPAPGMLRRAPAGSVALAAPGWQAAVYVDGETSAPLVLAMPPGPYQADWVDTKTGAVVKTAPIRHAGGDLALAPPPYREDIALRVRRTDGKRPPPPPPPRKPAGLYRAINLGGGPLMIAGVPWEGGAAGGVMYTGSAFENQSVPLNPATGAARTAMIRSSIWNHDGSNVTLTGVPAGAYEVYLTVWEDNDSQTFDIAVNGVTVRRGYASDGVGHWERLGPWLVTVTEGRIALRCTPSDANLSGLEVWRCPAGPKKGDPMERSLPAAKPGVRAQSAPIGLRVSANGRYLVRADGKPFLWLGDTAWLLCQATTREEAELYLRTRAEQGFTVIQAALVMGEERVSGTLQPNRYGAKAFEHDDPAHPDLQQGYWDYVDFLVERARARGLILGLLPHFVGWGGEGYKYLTPANAYAYGLFLGQRYRRAGNIIWILGGDNVPDTESRRAVWNELARGITVGTAGTEDYTRTLMTYHISGGSSSSRWFHKAPWLDFNMAQVWGSEKDIPAQIAQDYALTPVKPCGLGEGSYEDGPQYPTRPVDARKVRRQAYWSYLSGGYHTYGNTNVWNFGTYKPEATQDWKQALRSPGAASLSVLAKLLASAAWWTLTPDNALFANGPGSGDTRNAAARSETGDRAVIYLAAPGTATLRLDRLAARNGVRATWIDPRTGARAPAGTFPASGAQAFTTPDTWPDAALLLEAKR